MISKRTLYSACIALNLGLITPVLQANLLQSLCRPFSWASSQVKQRPILAAVVGLGTIALTAGLYCWWIKTAKPNNSNKPANDKYHQKKKQDKKIEIKVEDDRNAQLPLKIDKAKEEQQDGLLYKKEYEQTLKAFLNAHQQPLKVNAQEKNQREKEKASISFIPVIGEEKIPFERELMCRGLTVSNQMTKLEGYWAGFPIHGPNDPNVIKDEYQGKYPFPIPHATPWSGKEEFLGKLAAMESAASKNNMVECWEKNKLERMMVAPYRGHAPNRLNLDETMGSKSYVVMVRENGMIWWTQGFYKYVSRYHVIPSREFYRFVMNFEL